VRERDSIRFLPHLPLAIAMVLVLRVLPAQGVPGATPTAQSSPAVSTLEVHVPIVQEDLVVLDRNGQPVRGLKPSDLTVTENGLPVTLSHFEEHSMPATVKSAAEPKPPSLGPNVFSNLVAVPDDAPLNILLLDSLNTPMADQSSVRQEALAYLKTLPTGVPIAIFEMDTQLHLLQGFTADPELLRAALDAKRSIVHASPFLNEKVSDPDKLMKAPGLQVPTTDRLPEAAASLVQQQASYTLQGMNQLGRYLSGLPGRKNLIWFSASFPLGNLPGILVRSRVALYPVDSRGIMPPPDCTGPACLAILSKRSSQILAEHRAMLKLAESTGGEAFYDTNAFKEAMGKALSDGNDYYTLTYTPPSQNETAGSRAIAITASRPDLRLSYRTSYFAGSPDKSPPNKNAPAPSPNLLRAAMMPGAPNATQIPFEVQVTPGDATTGKVAKGAKLDVALVKPPYRSYDLLVVVDIHNVAFSAGADGVHHGMLEFVTLVYNSGGEVVNQAENKVPLDVPADRYAEILARGLHVSQSIEAPANGDYFLRIGIHDIPGNRVGATEVSLFGLKSTQALTANKAKPE
jgi:VWFA-related protein